MKSVIRNAFDPLPRFPSARMQLGVSLVLVAGIAISVLEYLESSRLARKSAVEAAESTVAPPRASTAPARCVAPSAAGSRWTASRAAPSANAAECRPSALGSSGAASAGRSSPMSFQPGEDG